MATFDLAVLIWSRGDVPELDAASCTVKQTRGELGAVVALQAAESETQRFPDLEKRRVWSAGSAAGRGGAREKRVHPSMAVYLVHLVAADLGHLTSICTEAPGWCFSKRRSCRGRTARRRLLAAGEAQCARRPSGSWPRQVAFVDALNQIPRARAP